MYDKAAELQRDSTVGYEDCVPHDSSLRLLLCSHHSGFVGNISTKCFYVNIKFTLFSVD